MNGIDPILKLTLEEAHSHGVMGLRDNEHEEAKLQNFKNQIYFHLFKIISQLFHEKVVGLKGISLLGELYSDFSMRSLGDLDLLVTDKETMSQFQEYLNIEGFHKVATEEWEGNDFKKVYSKNISGIEFVLEIHEKLLYLKKEPELKFKLNQSGCWILDDVSNVFHLIHHLSYQHTFLKLSWLYDLFFFIKKNPKAFYEVALLSKEYNLSASFDFTIRALEVYFQLNLSDFYIDSKRLSLKLVSYTFLVNPETNLLRYYVIKHCTKDSFFVALRYDVLWFKHKLMSKIIQIFGKKNFS